ncbi:MAG TPA: hypothetical protein VF584_19980 [Longimicrobium sp.]|jgi:hypothetical protein
MTRSLSFVVLASLGKVRDPKGELVCVTINKCGAAEVARRRSLTEAQAQQPW